MNPPAGPPLRSFASFAAACSLLTLACLADPPRLQAQPGADPSAAGPSDLSVSPKLSINGFSDVTLHVQRDRIAGADSSSSGFALGQFDLFFVARLAPDLSFLGESVFEFDETGASVVDVERALVKYEWSDLVRMSVGRSHTPLGYWNEAYHHGAMLQPTVERPEALKFEDDGGILPVHSVGLELSGTAQAGAWDVRYVSVLANGRGRTREEIQGSRDLTGQKAFGIKLTLATGGMGRFELGPAHFRDRIPADPGTPGRANELLEHITGLHLRFDQTPVTVLAECYRVRHEDLGSGARWNHDAWYAIAQVGSGRLHPYAGFDRLDFAAGDPFYSPDDRDLSRVIVGLRFDPGPFNAVKLEYRHDWRPQEEAHALLAQTSFAF